MAQRITPTQAQHIARLHDQGYTITAIAAKLGVDRHTAGKHVAKKDASAGRVPESVLMPEDRAYLDALRELLLLGPCPNPACGKRIVMLRHLSENEGVCKHCGEEWRMTVAERK